MAEDAPDTVIQLADAFDDKEDDPEQLVFEVKSNSNPDLFDAVTINQGLATLTLNYKPNTSGSATLTIKATDKGIPGVPNSSQSVETSFDVTVGTVNDAPTLADFSKNTTERMRPSSSRSTTSPRSIDDDDGDPLVNVRIESLPADGTLKLGATNVTDNQVIAAADLGNLIFVPAPNWDQGATTFDWNASDGAAYAAAPATVTINVEAKNDAPIVTNFEKSGQEGINVLFTATDFTGSFSDVDGDTLAKIKIDSLPVHGSLKLGNNTVTVNQQINKDSLERSALRARTILLRRGWLQLVRLRRHGLLIAGHGQANPQPQERRADARPERRQRGNRLQRHVRGRWRPGGHRRAKSEYHRH